MKKKLWLMLLALASALCICFGIAACSRRGGGTRAPSEGLEFELNADETSYTVTGIGTCTDRNIVIPSEYQGHPVTAIEARAFYNCSSLQSITIPESVTSIGNNAFYGTAFYNDDANWISDVLYIGDYLIEAKSTISGTCNIREGTKLIADGAFYECRSLKSITIPESVTTIGSEAFGGCLSLNAVYITDLEAWCGIDFDNYYDSDFANPLYWAHHLYVDGQEVTDLHIPDCITEIKRYTFCGGAFTSVTIPAGVTSIGEAAFSCSSLTSITIPASVTLIGESAFSSCSSLQSVTFEGDSKLTSIGWHAFSHCSSLESITIPESVTSIGNWAFSGCSSLQSIAIPASVTSIGWGAFNRCSSLKIVRFEQTDGWKVSRNSDVSNAQAVTVSDPQTAARYLTNTYENYYWKRY